MYDNLDIFDARCYYFKRKLNERRFRLNVEEHVQRVINWTGKAV